MPFTPPPDEPILPPDGTYPPRLLSKRPSCIDYFAESIWLYVDQQIELIPDELIVRSEGDHRILAPLLGARQDVYVNGKLLLLDGHRLQDGDFIHWDEDNRLIYQADPVKDRRKLLFEDEDGSTIGRDDWLIIQPQLTDRLRQYAIINPEGLSFNGGADFARWDTIRYVSLNYDNNRFGYAAYIQTNDQEKFHKSKLTAITSQELQELFLWFNLAQPFDLTLWTNTQIWNIFPDAYWVTAWNKIYIPAERGERDWPAEDFFIFGFPSPRGDLLLRFAAYLAIAVIGLIYFGALTARFNWATALLIIGGFVGCTRLYSHYRRSVNSSRWEQRIQQAAMNPKPRNTNIKG